MRGSLWTFAALLVALVLFALIGCASDSSIRSERTRPYDWASSADLWEQASNQPLPPGVCRVTLSRYDVDERDVEAVHAALRYRDDRVRVDVGDLGGANGLTIFAAAGSVEAAIHASRQTRLKRHESTGFLLLNQGTRGSLQLIEQRYALPWRVVCPVYRKGRIVRRIDTEVSGTGMVVGVGRVQGDWVTITLQPYFHSRYDDRVLVIDELSTTLRVRLGQGYVIMARRGTETTVGEGLLWRSTVHRNSQVLAVLRVEAGPSEAGDEVELR